jgi:hypothetical protein
MQSHFAAEELMKQMLWYEQFLTRLVLLHWGSFSMQSLF